MDKYIKYQDVKRILENLRDKCGNDEMAFALNYGLGLITTNLPSENVTLIQQATWIPVTNGRGGHECSACQDYAPSYQNGEERLSLFCPSCGAMMLRGVDND